MGRIKTAFIKRKTRELLKKRGESMTTDFTENKIQVNKFTTVSGKKLRNVIAGYISRLKKRE